MLNAGSLNLQSAQKRGVRSLEPTKKPTNIGRKYKRGAVSTTNFLPGTIQQEQTNQRKKDNVSLNNVPSVNKVQVAEPDFQLEHPWHQQACKHVIEAQQFDKESLRIIFNEANQMKMIQRNTEEAEQLKGYTMATLFYEPSTRTRLSFESAMNKLGGMVISTESAAEFSSAAKGETLEDTIRTVEAYSDIIVLRHFEGGSAKRAAQAASVPVISAGDGPGQHPTQSLLDVYTIEQEIGSLEKQFNIAMIGDLANGRTVRSLACLLSMYKNVNMYFVAPDIVQIGNDVIGLLNERGIKWEKVKDLREVAGDTDVLYNTRIQKERFSNMEDYEKVKGRYIIDKELMNMCKKEAVIMHPLPRVDEISPEVDDDDRAAYFRQAKNGLYIRMALLKLCVLD